ncbi:undecaprenyl-diphosphate phosphatase [Sphingomonas sp. MAH-20]|uniref:Undecaprenyl-diphosphatase n=1 Tax=Sphingomonas horti TaxID=2682842 RepID=A0A6I4J2N0_9SPHN|nr:MULTISPECIES: undecaprenyl-diphosphate phosphatase [Sphingomonas]MBA2918586.1 undecaprenyl-diphosphate phosphatase [Sphingomonas sp. CGMCC 1.13658]MVO78617.1 undecaprenyl-diphosphate phosphatase [Sphingomonas horti]
MPLLLTAILLGIVEGLTEFLPVSSTGHLILASELLGYKAETWATFNVIIQLGAILAVIVLYWRTFWAVATGVFKGEATSFRFIANLLLAFVPSVVLGLIFIDRIEALLGNAVVVAVALVLGGVAILVIEALVKAPEEAPGVAAVPWRKALGIGLLQCLAMIPGVSRSGATIMGALALGVERRTAAEFSFFLAVPTMLGATTLEVVKNHDELTSGHVDWGLVGVGFVVSFLVAIVVIRWFVGLISRRGFAPFAWYRIVAGSVALVWLLAR